MARPTKYNQDIAIFICNELAGGKTLTQIIKEKEPGVPSSIVTIYNWLDSHDEFLKAYMRARKWQAHTFADETVYLSDQAVKDDKIAADKLRVQVDTRKWHASKMQPTQFGEPVLMRNKVARKEEQEYIEEMKNITPADDGDDELPSDPKQIVRMFNWVMTKNQRKIEGKSD